MSSPVLATQRSPSQDGSTRSRKDAEKGRVVGPVRGDEPDLTSVSSDGKADYTHRNLKPRHIQLIGVGGTVATALFIQIGNGLIDGGPGSLFIAFTLWCSVILAVTVSMAEMVTYLPISSPFIRFAGRFCDDALGVAAGWNFFVYEVALATFEVTACNVIIHFWSDIVPAGGIIAIVLVLYALINLLAVEYYGETEFWAALGKMILITGLIIFTFIAMLGGNPDHDRFGFRYWNTPGAFATYYSKGDLGRFQGFLGALITASFTVAGPDYVSMAAGEAENPRVSMPRAYNSVFYRLTAFFVLGSLAVGILVPYDDKQLSDALLNGAPGAAASPYVVAMRRLHIPVLPDIVNALILTSAFSAGNSYIYCSSRSLYGMALEGKAPRFLTKCNSKGVPFYCVICVLCITLLSFLQVSQNAAVVLNWFVSLVTASQLINFCIMSFTYLCFYRALKAQGIDRKSLPYQGWFQPYTAWYGFIGTLMMVFVGGYTVFLPGKWDAVTFVFSYAMVAVVPAIYLLYKLIRRTKFRRAHQVDLHSGLAEIEDYTRNYVPTPPRNFFERALDWLFS
ncbi:hypothetical protein VTK73DRAFT_10066 [Phialemonium thermophilum]|uniref:Amino acid permease/ SLC12A domain-containing protein n=1 Tax=Phialemonium thermophilum TaxID=223376 RepID=A0ABR3VZ06_9PEZI